MLRPVRTRVEHILGRGARTPSNRPLHAPSSRLAPSSIAMTDMPEKNEPFIKSAANIPGVKTALVNTLNVYDVLNGGKFIIAKDAVAQLEEVYA